MTLAGIGIGVVGYGWMGQAHSRSAARIPSLFPEREFDPRLVICSDQLAQRRSEAVAGAGFQRASPDWHDVVDSADVDVVYVAAPNMLHEQIAITAAEAGKHVFCGKTRGRYT